MVKVNHKMASFYNQATSTERIIQTYCQDCQDEVSARLDEQGGYYCVECGELIAPTSSASASASASANATSTSTTPTPTSANSEALLGALLNQALLNNSDHSFDAMGPMTGNANLTPQMQERFQMLLPMFQNLLESQNGTVLNGFGGSSNSGAPPAAATAVDALERLTLDSSNLREVTQRVIVRVAHNAGQDSTTPPRTIELVCEPAAFGPAVKDCSLQHCPLVVASPMELDTLPHNGEQIKGKVCVVKRGKCSFAVKVLRAQAAGAVGVIVLNTVAKWPFTMGDSKLEGGSIVIPAVMCRMDHSTVLLTKLVGGGGGAAAAATAATTALPEKWCVTMQIDEDTRSCAVCQSEFELTDEVIRMPCPGFHHTFHKDCIMPWLKMRNTCPTCRHELPTDNKTWDRKRAEERASVDVEREYYYSNYN